MDDEMPITDRCQVCGKTAYVEPMDDKLDNNELKWVCEECMAEDPGRYG